MAPLANRTHLDTPLTYCQLPFHFDVAALQADLERLSQHAWIRHFVPENYSGDWSALPLRAVGGDGNNIFTGAPDIRAFEDTPLLAASPYFRHVLASFRCPLTTVRLMRLAPGGVIKEHVDDGAGYEYGQLRLHVPITTNPEVSFVVDGQQVPMAPGECWYINAAVPHSVANRGSTDRIHLLIDGIANDWADEILAGLGFSAVEKYGTRVRLMEDNIAGLRKMDTPEARRALDVLLGQQAEIETAQQARAAKAGDARNG